MPQRKRSLRSGEMQMGRPRVNSRRGGQVRRRRRVLEVEGRWSQSWIESWFLDFAQIDPKGGSFTGGGDQTDSSTHPFHRFADDGQSDTGSRVSRMRMKSLEKLENPVLV